MCMPFCEFDEKCTKFAILAKQVSYVKLTCVAIAFRRHRDMGNVVLAIFGFCAAL